MITYIDFFAGIGLASLAFKDLGFKAKMAIELNATGQQVYLQNLGFRPKGDIASVRLPSVPRVDFYFISPPMRTHAQSNNSNSASYKVESILFARTFEFISYHQPKMVVFELMASLKKKDGGQWLKIINKGLKQLGYRVNHYSLNSYDFGTSLHRSSIYLFAIASTYPNFSLKLPSESRSKTIRESISHLPLRLDKILDFSLYQIQPSTFLSKIHYCGYLKKGKLKDIPATTRVSNKIIPQGHRIVKDTGLHPSFSASERGYRYFIYRTDFDLVQQLSVEEAYAIAGVPSYFLPHSYTNVSCWQLGQSSSYPMVRYIGEQIKEYFTQIR